MLTAPVRIHAHLEANVGAVVASERTSGRVAEVLGALPRLRIVRIDELVIRLHAEQLEAVGGIVGSTAAVYGE